jgi:hypothetical protein
MRAKQASHTLKQKGYDITTWEGDCAIQCVGHIPTLGGKVDSLAQ